MDNREISLIIPIYNAEAYLQDCIRAVDSQIFEDFELILVDDGSTDGTAATLDKLTSLEKPYDIKVIHTPNRGVSAARNTGLAASAGRFVVFADVDDGPLEDYLLRLHTAILDGYYMVTMRDDNASMALSDRGDVSKCSKIAGSEIYARMTGYEYIRRALLERDNHVWGKIYLRDKIDELIGGKWFTEGMAIGEDMLMLLDIAMAIGDERLIGAIPAGSYEYTINENGAMLSPFKASDMDQIRSWRMAYEVMKERKDCFSDDTFVRLSVIRIMAAIIVAGKLYAIPASLADRKREYIDGIRAAVTDSLMTKGTFAALDIGYKVKTLLFLISPGLYIFIYGSLKRK
ncbi:glycosyltransferase family 2 protein [Butyrivibrio sp. MC2013]|uniref:glycosyltransferase family 2 protein n=1 Tax=Butyrivibrio sp. MC2013 TaxID=1280686 RepID=UPI00040B6279|nr:glycosyltransferase [Butyrivibrio sp. MC2013]